MPGNHRGLRPTRPWRNREQTRTNRATGDRDETIVSLLLDTGVRAQELCDIKITDLNQGARSIRVVGKGRKARMVYYGKRTAKVLDRYLVTRLRRDDGVEYLFVVGPQDDFRPMTRDYLRRLLARIGERASVKNVYPHRFRHTFAIEMLRNGANPMVLQDQLGHRDMTMVRRYAHTLDADVAKAHQQASPVDNWRL